MNKRLLLVIFFLCLWCNSCLAFTRVPMDDTHNFYYLLEKYNNTFKNSKNSNIGNKYVIPKNFQRWPESFIKDTTAYVSQNTYSKILFIACLNENEHLEAFSVCTPPKKDFSECILVAFWFMTFIDDDLRYEDVIGKCYNALATDGTVQLYSPKKGRYYSFTGDTNMHGHSLVVMAYIE